jgi:hypothetical protein
MNYTTQGLWHPSFKTLLGLNFLWLANKIYSNQSNFEVEDLGEFLTKFVNILGYESGAQLGLIDIKKQELKISRTLSLHVSHNNPTVS